LVVVRRCRRSMLRQVAACAGGWRRREQVERDSSTLAPRLSHCRYGERHRTAEAVPRLHQDAGTRRVNLCSLAPKRNTECIVVNSTLALCLTYFLRPWLWKIRQNPPEYVVCRFKKYVERDLTRSFPLPRRAQHVRRAYLVYFMAFIGRQSTDQQLINQPLLRNWPRKLPNSAK